MNRILIISLTVILLSECNSPAPINRGEVCYAIERNEIYLQGFLHQNRDGELLIDFSESKNGTFTTGRLIGCSEFVSEALVRFHHANKRYQYLGRVKVGLWGIVLKPSKENQQADIIAEQIVAL